MTNCKCGNKLDVIHFRINTVIYCSVCGYHSVDEIKCNHEYIPVKFKLSNESYQLRLFCLKCKSLDPKPKKMIDFPEVKYTRVLSEYQDYINATDLPYYNLKQKLSELYRCSHSSKYLDYLKSDEWKQIRKFILTRDSNTCQICGNEAEHVHHLNYAHLYHEYYFELVSLCKNCHKLHYHIDKFIETDNKDVF